MRKMFYRYYLLIVRYLFNFNTINIKNMSNMFEDCKSLRILNLSNFNTNNATNIYAMFKGNTSIKNIILSGLKIKM